MRQRIHSFIYYNTYIQHFTITFCRLFKKSSDTKRNINAVKAFFFTRFEQDFLCKVCKFYGFIFSKVKNKILPFTERRAVFLKCGYFLLLKGLFDSQDIGKSCYFEYLHYCFFKLWRGIGIYFAFDC